MDDTSINVKRVRFFDKVQKAILTEYPDKEITVEIRGENSFLTIKMNSFFSIELALDTYYRDDEGGQEEKIKEILSVIEENMEHPPSSPENIIDLVNAKAAFDRERKRNHVFGFIYSIFLLLILGALILLKGKAYYVVLPVLISEALLFLFGRKKNREGDEAIRRYSFLSACEEYIPNGFETYSEENAVKAMKHVKAILKDTKYEVLNISSLLDNFIDHPEEFYQDGKLVSDYRMKMFEKAADNR